MEIGSVCASLSNETRRKLVSIIHSEGPLSSKEAHEKFLENENDLRRESVYKALEKLVSANILDKEYEEGRGIVYKLDSTRIVLDLGEMSATTSSSK